jgi:opacity protein-like surface antigen
MGDAMTGYRGASCLAATALAASLVLAAGGAAAQGLAGAAWYVKGFGGATFPEDQDFTLRPRGGGPGVDSGLDFDTGYVLGIAGGVDLTPNLAVELEYAYRNADVSLTGLGVDVDGRSESNAWMVNALYKMSPLGPTGQWQPYVGGGLGAADLNVEDLDLPGGDFDSDYNLAYQLIGGVAYNLNPNLSLTGEVRFFGINDQDIENDDLTFKTTYHTIDLLVGVLYRF